MLKLKEGLKLAANQERIYQIQLARLTFEKVDSLSLLEDEESPVLKLDESLDYKKSLFLKTKESMIAAADLNFEAEKSKASPEFSVSASWAKVKDSQLEKSISLNLKYQIPVSDRPASLQESRTSLALLRTEKHFLELQIQQRFSAWQEQIKSLNELIPSHEKRLKTTSEWVKIQEERYTAGAISFHMLNHAKESLDTSKLDLQTRKVERNKLLGLIKAEMGLLL